MSAPDPKQNQPQSGTDAQQGAYPLERYTVAPQSGNDGGEKSPYYQSAAPSISLPKGGGALKGIDEKFTVNAVNGTAGLQVGLPLSPGRGGFTPSLGLSYNSGSGNSEFGLGWSLGLPAIQRKTDKRLPQYNDADESDVFLLAGAEDLQPYLVYNAGTATWDRVIDQVTEGGSHYTVKRYRPRIEGLYAKIEYIIRREGGCWWKVTTKDNMVTYYGVTSGGRLSDPEDDTRVFKWLPQVSYDSKGNVQLYTYFTDDNAAGIPAALHERNRINSYARLTNIYLQNVKYCNKTPYLVPDTIVYDISALMPDPVDFLMEAVMDYGNHNTDAPTPVPDLPLPFRTDPFSDFHACFEIRTYRRCMRALMFHYFEEMDGGAPVLVRSLDFEYHIPPGSAAYAEADYIVAITLSGYTQARDHSYYKKSLPALSMAYEPLTWDHTVHNVSPADAVNAPQGLTGAYLWIDLWGEGLPGILTEQADSWLYKRNLGDAHFTPAMPVAEKPSFQGLGNNMQWQDLDADGRRQLVSRDGALSGYFELDDEQHWQHFRAFKENVNIDWNSPFTKMLDLNGDGRPDVLIAEDRVWKWYENEGTEGFADGGYGQVHYDEERGPRLLLNDAVQVIFLADMNGDGMTDLVRIQNGEVCYWPNMGYGKFGARVTMTDSPWFDTPNIFNPQYITLADISGTGAPDIIYIGKEKCTAWINLAGNAWSGPTFISPLPSAEPYSKITVTDFLGNGTACIVWSSPLPHNAWAPMRYIDLMGGKKPYLAISYTNNMGKTVALEYKQSTKYYLEDEAAGHPWATRLPFPVHCVSKITTTDDVSQTIYRQQYSYHHGYYDHPEREFRGFGRVDTLDTDMAIAYDATTGHDLDQFPVLTKTWNHTGAWMQEETLLQAFEREYYHYVPLPLPAPPSLPWPALPTDPDILATTEDPATAVTAQEQREAYRAMKGQPIRQEVYALDNSGLDDIPYAVTTNAYCIQVVQPVAGNRYSVCRSYQQQSLSISCERIPKDPHIVQELVLATDVYGNVLQSAKVAYPRRFTVSPSLPAEVVAVQNKMLISASVTDYTNDVLTTDYHLRVPYNVVAYELTGITPAGVLWTCPELKTAITAATAILYTDTPNGTAQKRLLGTDRTLFQSNNTVTVLALNTIESLAIPYQHYKLAFADDMIFDADYYDGRANDATLFANAGYLPTSAITQFPPDSAQNYWLPSGTAMIDAAHFYTPVSATDPWGNTTAITMWDNTGTDYYLLPQSVTDALGNTTTVEAYNWCNLQPTRIKDANDNISTILFDALGMPVAMATMGKDDGTEGDTLAGMDPDSSTDLANQAAFFTDLESVAADLLAGATWRTVYDLTASPIAVGMIGREYHHFGTHPTPVPPEDNGLLIRLTYTDGLGRIAMHKVQAAPAEGETDIRWIGSGKTVYNNKGNVVMQYEPYFSDTWLYDDAEQAAAAGVTARMHYDALSRVIRTDLPDGTFTKNEWDGWTQKVYDNNDTVVDSQWYHDATLSTAPPELQDAAEKAAHHYNTPTTMYLDTLGRPFYTRQHNRLPDTSSPPVWGDYYYGSYAVLDISGNRRAVYDARGLAATTPFTTLTCSYNMVGAPVKQNSMDSGNQYTLTDAAGQPTYAWDADDRQFFIERDELRRQIRKHIIAPFTAVPEQTVYGETVSGAAALNLKGKVYKSYDGVGMKTVPAYDFKGNPLQAEQYLLTDGTITDVDWSASPALNTETFTSAITYDALSRPITSTDPGNNITRHEYDAGGTLFAVYMTPDGGTESAYVSATYHDAKGQRLKIVYGNGTKTTYEYDPNTFRVVRVLTRKNTDRYQDLNYWYDPVGNATMVLDAAQRELFFDNSVTLPAQNFTYDALYRLIIATGREKQSNANFTATDNYNDADWMSMIVRGNDTGCQNYTQKYENDEVGNITKLRHIAAVGSYTRTYNYDATSNKLLSTQVGTAYPYTYDYTHDTRGNIDSMPHLSAITYNAANVLSIANLGGGGMAYYQYSGVERGRKLIVNGVIKEERIYFGGFEIYRKYVGTTLEVERTTTHVSDGAGLIAMLEVRIVGTDPAPASLTRYIYSNNLSTASLELDENAAIISYEEYHPYGTTSYQETNDTINAVAKRYRYVGKERDEETGFYYMSARYYAPWLCRWVAYDPINLEWYNMTQGNSGRNKERQTTEFTASGYEYCYANPVRFTDPGGEQVSTDQENSKIKQEDIPTVKIEKPGLLYSGYKVWMHEGHQLQAQSFAYSRQNQPGVAGVSIFDYNAFNTVVVTFNKYTAITVNSDGTNTESTEYNATYTVFRADMNFLSKAKSYSEEEFFNTDRAKLFSGSIFYIDTGFGGAAKSGEKELVKYGLKVSKAAIAQSIAKYGLKSYEELKKLTTGTGLQVHHLLEKRFADILGVKQSKMLSIVLDANDHVKFTTLWRLEIGYETSTKLMRTSKVSPRQVEQAARRIYKDYPQILKALNLL